MLFSIFYLMCCLIRIGIIATVTVSQNVSVGQIVNFICVSAKSSDVITWNTMPNIESTTIMIENLPGGQTRSVLRFTALQEHNNTNVRCIITDPNTSTGTISNALLLIQG